MQSTLDRLAEWMTQQSWYSPAPDGVPRLRELAELFLPCADPLARVRVMLVRDDGPDEPVIYQLPVVERDVLPDPSAPGLIGRGYGGAALFDGVVDAAFASALLAGMHEAGRLIDEADDRFVIGTELLSDEGSVARMIVRPYGRPPLAVSLFRRVLPDAHPHAIAAEALAAEAPAAAGVDGTTRITPRLAGTLPIRWSDDGVEVVAHLAIAQERVEGGVDGWSVAVDAASSGRSFDADAGGIGRALAHAHDRLRRRLGSRPLSPESRAATVDAWRARTVAAAVEAPALAPLLGALDTVRRDAESVALWPEPQTVHGALELGLTERTPDGEWMLRAFGGRSPAPADERTDLALRDVAGAIRSLHYAASLVGAEPLWESTARRALLEGYEAVAGPVVRELLDALEVDFAVVDAVWEARTRPDHIGIPLAAIARVASDAALRAGELSAA